jgi:pre-mRNA-processing factor 40
MLGTPGSNPLELFWDVVDALDQKLDAKVGVVNDAIAAYNAAAKIDPKVAEEGEEPKGFVLSADTTFDSFAGVVRNDEEVKRLSEKDLQLVYYAVGFIHYYLV